MKFNNCNSNIGTSNLVGTVVRLITNLLKLSNYAKGIDTVDYYKDVFIGRTVWK